MGIIVTITTGGPVPMETGGSCGWDRDKREDTCTQIYTHLGYTVYTHTVHVSSSPSLTKRVIFLGSSQQFVRSSPAVTADGTCQAQGQERWLSARLHLKYVQLLNKNY